MPEIPDRINIDTGDWGLYNNLDQEEMMRHKGGGRTRKEQFLVAMAIGFKNNVRRPLKTKRDFFLTKDLRSEDETLLNAVAVHATDSVEVLSDREEVFKIAEEYAHAGIRLLVDRMDSLSHGSFEKQFEKELYEIYKKLG